MHFGLNEKDERLTNLQASFSWENKKKVFSQKMGISVEIEDDL